MILFKVLKIIYDFLNSSLCFPLSSQELFQSPSLLVFFSFFICLHFSHIGLLAVLYGFCTAVCLLHMAPSLTGFKCLLWFHLHNEAKFSLTLFNPVGVLFMRIILNSFCYSLILFIVPTHCNILESWLIHCFNYFIFSLPSGMYLP